MNFLKFEIGEIDSEGKFVVTDHEDELRRCLCLLAEQTNPVRCAADCAVIYASTSFLKNGENLEYALCFIGGDDSRLVIERTMPSECSIRVLRDGKTGHGKAIKFALRHVVATEYDRNGTATKPDKENWSIVIPLIFQHN